MMRSPTPESPVVVTSATVMRGDVIQIGGQSFELMDLINLSSRARRLRFRTGETLTMSSATGLSAMRPALRK
ncbi:MULTISPECIES: hypothetical protein [unclassified Streptomyces]|uniref:Uncharacterized protein n=1 Tax=Streptomyces sp. NBC_00060 TaxID=2975636 RepID=A0AAU2GZ76_9ACTN